jgi:hypothetical protein
VVLVAVLTLVLLGLAVKEEVPAIPLAAAAAAVSLAAAVADLAAAVVVLVSLLLF